jgi:hypothetical protein
MDKTKTTLLFTIGAIAIFAGAYYLGRQSKTYEDFLDELAENTEPIQD